MDIYYSYNWLYFYEFVVAVDCHSVQLALVPVEIWFATFVFHIKKGDDIAYEEFDRDCEQSLDDVIDKLEEEYEDDIVRVAGFT